MWVGRGRKGEEGKGGEARRKAPSISHAKTTRVIPRFRSVSLQQVTFTEVSTKSWGTKGSEIGTSAACDYTAPLEVPLRNETHLQRLTECKKH